MSALVVVGSEQNLACLVANTIANKTYFKPTPKRRTLKSYACSLAIDFRCGVSLFPALD